MLFAGEKPDPGNTVILEHGKNLKTLYAHLSTVSVEKNQSLQRGALIGTVGSTGNSTAPHLHYEVIKDGIQQNPEDYF